MSKGIAGYGRYDSDPQWVGCPRARSDMTPCIARDGHLALADDYLCVGCGERAEGLDGLLQALRHEVTGKSPAPVTIAGHAADKLRDLVRQVTEPTEKGHA